MFGSGAFDTKTLFQPIASFVCENDKYAIEVALTCASLWAAYVLYTPPSNFAAFHAGFALAETLQSQESKWAFLALLAALLKIFGIGFQTRKKYPTIFSDLLRLLGLGISGTFWLILGVSTIWGNPDTLFGVWGVLAGLLAWWGILKFIVYPGGI